MRIVVDRTRCTGMGICESIDPEHFDTGDDGVLTVRRDRADTLAALAAVASCPASSLSLDGARGVARLVWGVKASFLAYVRAVGGTVVADAGALEEDGAFVFPAAPSSPADLEWHFVGRATFAAHDGLLAVELRDPWVRLVDAGIELSVLDGTGRRRTLAHGRSDGPVDQAVPVVLAPGAEHLFGSTYPAGTELAPLTLATSA